MEVKTEKLIITLEGEEIEELHNILISALVYNRDKANSITSKEKSLAELLARRTQE